MRDMQCDGSFLLDSGMIPAMGKKSGSGIPTKMKGRDAMEWHEYIDEDHSECEHCKFLKDHRPFVSEVYIGIRNEPFTKRCSEMNDTEIKIVEWCMAPFGYKEWSDKKEEEWKEYMEEAYADSMRRDDDDYYY